jgi:hypothetical protein
MFGLRNISTSVALGAAVWTSAALGAAPILEVVPAWGGLTRAGQPTELAIRVQSAAEGAAELHVISGNFHERDWLTLRAQTPQTVRVALPADESTTVHVQLQQGHERIETTHALQSLPSTRRMIAVASELGRSIEAQTRSSGAAPLFRYFSASALPELPQGYAVLDALVIDQRTLHALNRNQLDALLSFLGQCGHVAAIGLDTAAAALLQQAAGCRGQFFITVHDDRTLAAGLAQLDAPAAALNYATIAPLAEKALSDAAVSNTALVVLFAAYLATLIVFARATAVLAVAGLTTAVAVFAWSTRDATIATLSWSELDAGDHAGRTITALSIQGRGRGSVELGYGAALGVPLATAPDSRVTLERRADEPTYRLRAATALGSAANLWFETAHVINDAPASVTLANGNPAVTNTSAAPIENAVLLWQGRQFAVPRLAAGEHWALAPTATTAILNPTLALAARRAESHPAALLVPYVPEPVKRLTPPTTDTGWLLIRYARAESAT